ncbi:MAG: hypothetical protein AAGF77_05870 [Bacteroidota bacterium]
MKTDQLKSLFCFFAFIAVSCYYNYTMLGTPPLLKPVLNTNKSVSKCATSNKDKIIEGKTTPTKNTTLNNALKH